MTIETRQARQERYKAFGQLIEDELKKTSKRDHNFLGLQELNICGLPCYFNQYFLRVLKERYDMAGLFERKIRKHTAYYDGLKQEAERSQYTIASYLGESQSSKKLLRFIQKERQKTISALGRKLKCIKSNIDSLESQTVQVFIEHLKASGMKTPTSKGEHKLLVRTLREFCENMTTKN